MNKLRNHIGLFIPILIVILLVLWPIVQGRPATREMYFTLLKAITLTASLNIVLGYTGYVSFGHIVFFGVGGYIGFYLISGQGWSLWIAMLAGGLMSAVLAFLLGTAILRLRGAYFALATIGVNEVMRALFNN